MRLPQKSCYSEHQQETKNAQDTSSLCSLPTCWIKGVLQPPYSRSCPPGGLARWGMTTRNSLAVFSLEGGGCSKTRWRHSPLGQILPGPLDAFISYGNVDKQVPLAPEGYQWQEQL